jgi:hypothetical protein
VETEITLDFLHGNMWEMIRWISQARKPIGRLFDSIVAVSHQRMINAAQTRQQFEENGGFGTAAPRRIDERRVYLEL